MRNRFFLVFFIVAYFDLFIFICCACLLPAYLLFFAVLCFCYCLFVFLFVFYLIAFFFLFLVVFFLFDCCICLLFVRLV